MMIFGSNSRLSTMLSTAFNKQELTAAFDALSQHRKLLLEIVLVAPKGAKTEGRGFFNDVDFLSEAISSHVGRFNFALSAFAYASDQIPSRGSYNQFDRSLVDHDGQDRTQAHSMTLGFFFKPEILREMAAVPDPREGVMQAAYQVGAVLERMQLRTFSLEYNPTAFVARFLPTALFSRTDLRKPQLIKWTQALLERVGKEMTPAEHKKFALGSSLLGQGFDPVPGLPGIFGDAKDLVTVWGLSPPRVAQEAFFTDLLDETLNGRKSQAMDVYAPANLQGLSQNWDTGDENDGILTSKPSNRSARPEREEPDQGFADRKQKEEAQQLAEYLKATASSTWTWPLFSQSFTRLYRGLPCGSVLLLQADPFAGSVAFDFLMQSAEPLAKEGKGQILVFTKKKAAAELALAALARHHRSHPMTQGSPSDPAEWARSYSTIFANPPFAPACAPHETLENLLNYLDHDFQLRRKRQGGAPLPLAILLDNLEEFRQGETPDTYRGLLRLKQKLRDLNATLWVTHLVPASAAEAARTYLGLADFQAVLDCDGSFETDSPDAAAWENGFALDPNLRQALPDLGLVRIGFAAQGSHRRYPGTYLYHRPTCLFTEKVAQG